MIDVNTTNSLVNGSLGVIEDIITDNNERVELIIVRLKGEKAGSQQKEKYSYIANDYKDCNGTPII